MHASYLGFKAPQYLRDCIFQAAFLFNSDYVVYLHLSVMAKLILI